MSPHSTRRALLRSSVPALGTALAGCSSLGGGKTKLTLTLMNFTPDPHRLYVQLFRSDRREREDAYVFDGEYELSGHTAGEGGRKEDANVVPSRPYLVRAETERISDHYHFFPDCSGGDRPRDELYVEVHEWSDEDPNEGLFLGFNQNACTGDSGFF